jgi:hypothetical protein
MDATAATAWVSAISGALVTIIGAATWAALRIMRMLGDLRQEASQRHGENVKRIDRIDHNTNGKLEELSRTIGTLQLEKGDLLARLEGALKTRGVGSRETDAAQASPPVR